MGRCREGNPLGDGFGVRVIMTTTTGNLGTGMVCRYMVSKWRNGRDGISLNGTKACSQVFC